jgi:hypothetical protein
LALGFESGLTSITISVEFQDDAVVDQAVDGGDGHGLIAEDLVPLPERVVAGDDQRSLFIPGEP